MPLYVFYCPTCGNTFEKRQPSEDRDLVDCPACGARANRRMALFSFKFHSPFTKDGEGFTSMNYHPDEYKERVRANAGKYD